MPGGRRRAPPRAAIGCCHGTSPSSRASIGRGACIPHPPPLAVVSPRALSRGAACQACTGLCPLRSPLPAQPRPRSPGARAPRPPRPRGAGI